MLFPARHHDGEGTLGYLLELFDAGQFLGSLTGGSQQPAAPIQQVDRKVVDTGNRDDHTSDQHQDFDKIEILRDKGEGVCHHLRAR